MSWLFMSAIRFGTPVCACTSEYGRSPRSPIAYSNVLFVSVALAGDCDSCCDRSGDQRREHHEQKPASGHAPSSAYGLAEPRAPPGGNGCRSDDDPVKVWCLGGLGSRPTR